MATLFRPPTLTPRSRATWLGMARSYRRAGHGMRRGSSQGWVGRSVPSPDRTTTVREPATSLSRSRKPLRRSCCSASPDAQASRRRTRRRPGSDPALRADCGTWGDGPARLRPRRRPRPPRPICSARWPWPRAATSPWSSGRSPWLYRSVSAVDGPGPVGVDPPGLGGPVDQDQLGLVAAGIAATRSWKLSSSRVGNAWRGASNRPNPPASCCTDNPRGSCQENRGDCRASRRRCDRGSARRAGT
jgi:hypothetical protein